MSISTHAELSELALRSIRELETEHGILASSRNEAYGCIFGRDSLITSLILLSVTEKGTGAHDEYVFALVRKSLSTLAALQGKEVNIESGEEPGKMIHEWRPADHEHLTKHGAPPWYLYPEGAMKNYDSVDATPLFLFALSEYVRASGDRAFVEDMLPAAEAALRWLEMYGDSNGDGFIDYGFHPARTYGGLRSQSWMDSTESLFYDGSDETPLYPVAPVEVQGYAYAALRGFADFYSGSGDFGAPARARALAEKAEALKKRFNESFVIEGSDGSVSFPYALDGNGTPLLAVRSAPGHLLFAVCRGENGEIESVLDRRFVPFLAARLMEDDLYVKEAGLRTLSSRSPRFEPASYHNGSIWPHDTALVALGLSVFGYLEAAEQLRHSLLSAFRHFKTPIELFGHADKGFIEYVGSHGKGACRVQAWSAAALLAAVAAPERPPPAAALRAEAEAAEARIADMTLPANV